MRMPFVVGRRKGNCTEIVLLGEDCGTGEVPFFRGARMTRTPARFRAQPRRSAIRPV